MPQGLSISLSGLLLYYVVISPGFTGIHGFILLIKKKLCKNNVKIVV